MLYISNDIFYYIQQAIFVKQYKHWVFAGINLLAHFCHPFFVFL